MIIVGTAYNSQPISTSYVFFRHRPQVVTIGDIKREKQKKKERENEKRTYNNISTYIKEVYFIKFRGKPADVLRIPTVYKSYWR